MTIARRLTEIRASLGLTQAEMAERVGVKRDTWRRYEGGDTPTGEPLLALWNLGFSINWILSGQGEMRADADAALREESAEFRGRAVDTEFLGRVTDAVIQLYRQENVRLPGADQGRIAGELYNDLVHIVDEAERRGALRYAIEQKRKELRQAALGQPSSKRSA